MPKVSVIIPTHNSAQHLPDAIDSILKQTYQDFEIVVIDDGSTDNTKEIVEKYIQTHGSKIRYVYQKNKGVGSARNKGIDESRGTYITFLDSDDVILSNSLLRREQFLNKNPDTSLVFTDYYFITRESNTMNHPRLSENKFLNLSKGTILSIKDDEIVFNQDFYCKFLEFSPLPIFMGTVMMRKEIINAIGLFRTDVSVGEDNDYWLRIISKYKAGFINQPLSCYQNIHSTLTRRTESYNLDCIKIYTEIYSGNRKNKIRTLAKKKLASACYELGYYYNSQYVRNKARRYLLKSIFFNFKNKDAYKALFRTVMPPWINKII